MYPRDGAEDPANNLSEEQIDSHRIIRRGIPFGGEVTAVERLAGKTLEQRGLLFVSYQANISMGFQFLQQCKQANQLQDFCLVLIDS